METVSFIPTPPTGPDPAHPPHEPPHALPLALLARVFAALLVLTALTVGVTWFDLGSANVFMALAIAVAKAGLVALYFMHLRYDSPINGLVLIVAMLFVALFIGVVMLDSREYQPNLQPPLSMPLPGQP
jgi:cytochrome c oxidase subunit IV